MRRNDIRAPATVASPTADDSATSYGNGYGDSPGYDKQRDGYPGVGAGGGLATDGELLAAGEVKAKRKKGKKGKRKQDEGEDEGLLPVDEAATSTIAGGGGGGGKKKKGSGSRVAPALPAAMADMEAGLTDATLQEVGTGWGRDGVEAPGTPLCRTWRRGEGRGGAHGGHGVPSGCSVEGPVRTSLPLTLLIYCSRVSAQWAGKTLSGCVVSHVSANVGVPLVRVHSPWQHVWEGC